jgi:hypothetical protein
MVLGTILEGSTPVVEEVRKFHLWMFLSLYYIAGPFGLVAGIFGALIAGALAQGVLRHATRRRWCKVGASTGAVIGVLTALFFVMRLRASVFPIMLVVPAVALVACTCGGALVGWLAWREFGSTTASA